MVHDTTGYDNWYHEIINHMCVSSNYVSYVLESLERNDYSIVEIKTVLKKSETQNKKVFAMLREDYLERERLENKLKDTKVLTAGELIDTLIRWTKEWIPGSERSIKRNHHMSNISSQCGVFKDIDQDVVDAAVVDLLNYIAGKYGMDLALYTKDLRG